MLLLPAPTFSTLGSLTLNHSDSGVQPSIWDRTPAATVLGEMLTLSCDGSFILGGLCLGQGLSSHRTGACEEIPSPSHTSALGRRPSFPGGLYWLHPFMSPLSLPLHFTVSQSISSAPGLQWGQGSSGRPSLISGHSHGGVIALGHRRDIEEVSTESQNRDRGGHKVQPGSPGHHPCSWSRLPSWTPPRTTSLPTTPTGSWALELLPTCALRAQASPRSSLVSTHIL